MLQAATFWEEGVTLEQLPCFLMTSMLVPKNSRKCRASVAAVPTWRDSRFWMSRVNALKSGMWPGLSLLMSLSDAFWQTSFWVAAAAGGGEGREGESWRQRVLLCCVFFAPLSTCWVLGRVLYQCDGNFQLAKSTTYTYVANTAYILTAIYKFETCKNSNNSQSCKLSTPEFVKTYQQKTCKNCYKFQTCKNSYKFEKQHQMAPSTVMQIKDLSFYMLMTWFDPVLQHFEKLGF